MNPAHQNGGGGSIFSGKSAHIKILALCLLCTLVYLYLYSEVSVQTLRIQELMEGTLHDFQNWKISVENWVHNLNKGDGDEVRKNSTTGSETEQQTVKNIIRTTIRTTVSTTTVGVQTTSNEMRLEREKILKNIVKGKDIPLLTLFTTWPSKAEKYLCHNNTVQNWMSLKPFVVPVLFSNESDLMDKVRAKGWKVLPISKTGGGIPVLKNMFLDVMREVKSHFYAYSNGDILFTDRLLDSLIGIMTSDKVNQSNPMMIIGQRTNVKDVTAEEASRWENIESIAKSRGKLFTTYAEDFFITKGDYPWKEIPDLVIGRRAYDNWLVLNARKRKFTTVDITSSSFAVHQTTKAGNYEGHHHKDGNYNHNLLRKLYKRLRYEAGLTSCAEKLTRRNETGRVIVQERKVPKGCFPI